MSVHAWGGMFEKWLRPTGTSRSGMVGCLASAPSAISATPALNGSSEGRSCEPPSGKMPTALPACSAWCTESNISDWSTYPCTLYADQPAAAAVTLGASAPSAAAGAGGEEAEEDAAAEEEGGPPLNGQSGAPRGPDGGQASDDEEEAQPPLPEAISAKGRDWRAGCSSDAPRRTHAQCTRVRAHAMHMLPCRHATMQHGCTHAPARAPPRAAPAS